MLSHIFFSSNILINSCISICIIFKLTFKTIGHMKNKNYFFKYLIKLYYVFRKIDKVLEILKNKVS